MRRILRFDVTSGSVFIRSRHSFPYPLDALGGDGGGVIGIDSHPSDPEEVLVYGAIALGLTVFMGLFLLDTAVGIRYLGIMKHAAGHDLTLDFSRMFQKSGQGPVETLSNIAVFVPFGFFLSEFLASAKRLRPGRRLGLATLAGFGLSLCIESLQLVLKVGFFELTDLVMNMVGAFVGALVSVGVSVVIK